MLLTCLLVIALGLIPSVVTFIAIGRKHRLHCHRRALEDAAWGAEYARVMPPWRSP